MFVSEEQRELETSRPADYSFKKLRTLQSIGLELARASRLGSVPERGSQKNKFLTRSIWLNNNKLKTITNIEEFVNSILEFPEQLAWIDFSMNYITEIDQAIDKFSNLKILYFHGNCIENLDEILKLRSLKGLKTVTFHGNPISNLPQYRMFVITALPQLMNLDFTPVLKTEKSMPAPTDILKKLREREKTGDK